jgi:hypothetical protein
MSPRSTSIASSHQPRNPSDPTQRNSLDTHQRNSLDTHQRNSLDTLKFTGHPSTKFTGHPVEIYWTPINCEAKGPMLGTNAGHPSDLLDTHQLRGECWTPINCEANAWPMLDTHQSPRMPAESPFLHRSIDGDRFGRPGFCYPPRFVPAAKRAPTVGLGSGPPPSTPGVQIGQATVGDPSCRQCTGGATWSYCD